MRWMLSCVGLMACGWGEAADVPRTPPAVGGAATASAMRPPMMPPGMMSRTLAYEVEVVRIAVDATGQPDPEGVARWTELAAAGFRVVQTQVVGSVHLLYCEHPVSNPSPDAPWRLPQVVEREPAVAERVRSVVEQQLREQERQGRALVTQMAPAGSPFGAMPERPREIPGEARNASASAAAEVPPGRRGSIIQLPDKGVPASR